MNPRQPARGAPCHSPPPSSRCCADTASSRKPNGCTPATSGPTAAWCSPPSSAGLSIRANLLRVVEVAAAAAGLQGVGVHTLRRSVAVGWLESGVHIKAVADLLGHSSISITGDIYGHTLDATTRAAVDGLTSALGLS